MSECELHSWQGFGSEHHCPYCENQRLIDEMADCGEMAWKQELGHWKAAATKWMVKHDRIQTKLDSAKFDLRDIANRCEAGNYSIALIRRAALDALETLKGDRDE